MKCHEQKSYLGDSKKIIKKNFNHLINKKQKISVKIEPSFYFMPQIYGIQGSNCTKWQMQLKLRRAVKHWNQTKTRRVT